jgi:hypothetical protein
MGRFAAQEPTGARVQELEVLVRTAIFKPANALIGYLLQTAAASEPAASSQACSGVFRVPKGSWR